MSFFLSSPPQPTYQKSYQAPLQQHSFFTPQTHRTTFFNSTDRPYPQFQPISPSPLRPTWNAGNVMRRQEQTSKTVFGENTNTWPGEPIQLQQENITEKNIQFTTQPNTSTSNTNIQPNIFSNQQQLPPQQNATASQRNPFTYQAPTQNLQPTNLLSTRLRNARSTRRTLFLDRLRTSRRDERDNHIIERFEKEEYWRERRRREERMEREARVEIEWEEEQEDWNEREDENEGEMTPVDEEEEVGELVEGWFEASRGQDLQQQVLEHRELMRDTGGAAAGVGVEDDSMDAEFDFEDSDVEEVFMQVLSQQPESQAQIQQQQQLQGLPPAGNEDALLSPSSHDRGIEGNTMGEQDMLASQRDTDML